MQAGQMEVRAPMDGVIASWDTQLALRLGQENGWDMFIILAIWECG